MKELTGNILEIQRMSTEDGPGLRTTVFFKGCTLKCTWCHNPESIHSGVEIRWSQTACIGCLTCLDVCETDALTMDDSGLHINRERCQRCGRCSEECPAMAIETIGTQWRADDLVSELIKDKAFFEKSDGGITLSGGEMTRQADFCRDTLKQLRTYGIHTAIDTCGQCSEAALDKVLPHTDLVLFDLKEMNPEKHKLFTGHSNDTILNNAIGVADRLCSDNKKTHMWIRTPVIPGATMTTDNIRMIGAFIAEHLEKVVTRWELCTFNNLCNDKYRSLGHPWKHAKTDLVTTEEINRIVAAAKQSGVNPDIIHWSGSVKSDDKDCNA